jgi:transposase
MENDPIARQRAELIIQVRSGNLSASAAAQQLGVSRKTYYKWEQRALAGMVTALSDRAGGRPAHERDAEREVLHAQVQTLEEQLRLQEQARRVNEILNEAGEKKG